MTIKVYNTLTRKKEEFIPTDNKIGIYVCGVTPYSATHLGHARPSVVWDVIRKFLRCQDYSVFLVQNFTDVDDKIIARSNEEGIPPLQLADNYAQEYLESMDALGVERADVYPKVSEHIEDIIEMVKSLIENNYAYVVDGNVFFDVAEFEVYGRLSNQKLDELISGTRFDVDPNKKNPMDFALWKKAEPGEPAWDSPWGEGRPGWHIECSAMSHKYLGDNFDFHGGGCDLIFPHHENELAQTKGATGECGARYWLHNGMLNLKAEKMSKSIGNFVTIKDVLDKHPKELLRFYILSNHYRSELEYHDEKLLEVKKGWQRFNDCVRNLERCIQIEHEKVALDDDEQAIYNKILDAKKKFVEAMSDDFNTALAIASLFDIMRDINGFLPVGVDSKGGQYVLSQALQLFYELAGDILGIIKTDEQVEGLEEPLMKILIDLRKELRAQKNYQLADKIRDQLQEINIVLEDTPQGTRWKVADE